MTRDEYIKYLRTQAYWLERLARELADELPIEELSTWNVDFEMVHPSELVETNEVGEDKHAA